MQVLWAPWRMSYILSGGAPADDCVFCSVVAGVAAADASAVAQRRRELLVLATTRHAFVIMNRFPYGAGHLMVVPRRHAADLDSLAADEHHALAELVRRAARVLREVLVPDGLNVGMNLGRAAGAGIVDHCHWHLVPRWQGDTNFMPLLGETRVISEHLEATYDRLFGAFAALGEPT